MMQRLSTLRCHLLLVAILWLAGGCDVEGDLPPCPWNVRVSYSYAPFGSKVPLKEVLRDLHEYLFDEQGILVGVDLGTKCKAEETDYHLPTGTYTLVTWGNMNGSTEAPDYEIGRSTLRELQMRATSGSMADLMYAAIPFRVAGEGRHVLKAALTDMYATLYINVHWLGSKVPRDKKLWRMELAKTPGVYSFLPDMQLQAFEENTALFLPQMSPSTVDYAMTPSVSDNALAGVFKTYRIGSQSSLVFCLYADGEPVMKKIDLGRLFSESGIHPEQDRYQQYEIVVTIGGDSVYAMFAVLSGWEEGGAIGGDGWN